MRWAVNNIEELEWLKEEEAEAKCCYIAAEVQALVLEKLSVASVDPSFEGFN